MNIQEPKNAYVRQLAGYPKPGHETVVSMGVLSTQLPSWDEIQIIPAQLAPKKPLLGKIDPVTQKELIPAKDLVNTDLTIGTGEHALQLDIPLIVSDMSFGSLSDVAKLTLAKGAEKAGTAICSGEGGILDFEAEANQRFMAQIGTAKFGYANFPKFSQQIKAIHFKGGQAAKTGTGGLLPEKKLSDAIREARAIGADHQGDLHSPSRFIDKESEADFIDWIREIREEKVKKHIPIGFKISANHIETDIQFALNIGVDYIILDGRGGSTGAAPSLFRNHISIPTMAALGRARKYMDSRGYEKGGSVKLIVTGGLRVPPDFIKALALGADAIAVSNSALQAIGCIATRKCFNNECPEGIATQDPGRIQTLFDRENKGDSVVIPPVDEGNPYANFKKIVDANDKSPKPSGKLHNFFLRAVEEMRTIAAACGHTHLNQFCLNDIATFNRELTYLAGVPYAGLRN